ncbi:MAG: hypothetical protein JSS10_01580 [Verrucomicrobia bacterium]|nr:hypothetical protein [Verrucomicrobiota bacterium]
MKFPKLNFSLPKFFQRKTTLEIKPTNFYRVWKRFIHQIPREFRSIIKEHQHFIVLGEEKSGKTELIQGIVEQSQNIYPFEVEYTQDLNMQFYLGPKQLIQEMAEPMVKDRTIKARKSLIHLWKRLYGKKPPIIVIAYNFLSEISRDSRDVSKSARMFAGKLSLLSEIVKEPLKIRIALTHLDKISGYLEFASFIKQHNLVFEIPIHSNFESLALEKALNSFRDRFLSLMLTTMPSEEFLKILKFFDELPKCFLEVEEFLRALITGNISGQFELEKLTFTTKMEPYTAFPSFDWDASEPSSIFFRHPMLKHQLASAAALTVCSGLILNNFFTDRFHLSLTQQGIDSLYRLKSDAFYNKIIPQIEHLNTHKYQHGYLSLLPRFYKQQIRESHQKLAKMIRHQILEPNLEKMMLKDQSELKALYMLGLIHAAPPNATAPQDLSTPQCRLGYHILESLKNWAAALNLDEKLIRIYIFNNENSSSNTIEIENLSKINPIVPLTSPAPWISFLSRFQDIVNQPVYTGYNFENLRTEASHLLAEYRRLKNDQDAIAVCQMLEEVPAKMLSDFGRNMQIAKWLTKEKKIEEFLVFVCQTCPDIPDITDYNISQFFAKINEIASLNDLPDREFKFILGDETFQFHTKKWVHLSVAHIIELSVRDYMTANKDTQGNIFFKNTADLPDLTFQTYGIEFPYFAEPVVVAGRYTRKAFEQNVRHTTESLLKLLESLPMNMEDKARFTTFVQEEAYSYAKQYQKEYERLYAACDIHTTSLEDVKEILDKIKEKSSAFQYFLNTINFNTEVFSNPPECLSGLTEINQFHFLRSLMSQAKNKSSPFEKYKELICQIIAELKMGTDTKNYLAAARLEDVLSPTAKITLSILRNDEDSFLQQVINDLNQIGVPPRYHPLFTAPIMQIYQLGIKDLKKSIDKLWSDALAPEIRYVLGKRPFNPDSTVVSTYEEVRKITNPTSEFFGIIRQIVTPVSTLIEGTWTPKKSSQLQLDPSLYYAVNRLTKISHMLWDKEGNPQPIPINVQTLPFESTGKAGSTPVLSYLVTGDETFHNFNQNPSWHLIKIEWWKENSSTVVVELANKSDNRSYRDEKVLNSSWSFFELLKKADAKAENVWQWKLGSQLGEKTASTPLNIGLKFETNPWNLFQAEAPLVQQTETETHIANK